MLSLNAAAWIEVDVEDELISQTCCPPHRCVGEQVNVFSLECGRSDGAS